MNPYDDPDGDLLARLMQAEADRIVPPGDGLTRIRARVDARQSRLRWLRPAIATGMAAAVAGVGIGVYTGLSTGNSHRVTVASDRTTTPPPTTTSSAASPSTTTATTTYQNVVTLVPDVFVYPFSSKDALESWVAGGGAQQDPWMLHPEQVAQHFMQHLGITVPMTTQIQPANENTDIVAMQVQDPNGNPQTFSSVRVEHTGGSSNAPWVVVGADAPYTQMQSPTPGETISSPVDVSFTSTGVDLSYALSVWAGSGDSSEQLGTPQQVQAGTGSVTQRVSFDVPSGVSTGFVEAIDYSAASDKPVPARLAIVPVQFGNAPAHQMPAHFVAAENGRIGLFDSKSGARVRWLTDAQPGGNASAPQLAPDGKWVYYLQGCGSSCNSLQKVSIQAGPPQQVVDAKGPFTAFAVGGSNDQFLAYATNHNGSGVVKWTNTESGQGGSFVLKSVPPLVEQLAWAPDGSKFAAQIRTGMAWSIREFNTSTANSVDAGTAVNCASADGSCSAPAYDGDGNLYELAANAANTTWRLDKVTPQGALSEVGPVPAEGSPENASVAITPDSFAAVITTATGRVYTMTYGKAVPAATNLGHASW